MLAVLAILSPAVSGQQVLYKTWGADDLDEMGWTVDRLDDLDGDGVSDMVVGAPSHYGSSSRVHVLSGATGGFILTISSTEGSYGEAVSGLSSLNGDALPDIAVGAPEADGAIQASGVLFLISGEDGSKLHSLEGSETGEELGRSLAVIPDLNGDGLDDIVVGAPGTKKGAKEDAGKVLVVSGDVSTTLLDVLWTDSGNMESGRLGQSVAVVGDLDADGFADVAVGEPGASRVRLYSGIDGESLGTLAGDFAGDGFGESVAGAGHVDADSIPDVIVGAPGGGYARVISGAEFVELWTLADGEPTTSCCEDCLHCMGFGSSVAGLGDLDGDGWADVGVGCPMLSKVWFYSGSTGAVLSVTASATEPNSTTGQTFGVAFGSALVSLGDVDEDGRPDIAIGAAVDQPSADYSGWLGSVSVVSGFIGPEWLVGPAARTSTAGDFDADGFLDLAVAAGADLRVQSGVNGTELLSFQGLSTIHAAAGGGDANGDGWDDVAIGTPQDSTGGANRGSVTVFSGMDGSTLLFLQGAGAGDCFGKAVDFLGDVDDDGRDDLLVGAPAAMSPPSATLYPHDAPGYVEILSGLDGSLLLHVDGTPVDTTGCGDGYAGQGEWFGWSAAGTGDIDGDGVADFIVGALGAGTACFDRFGQARVFSGADGGLLFTLEEGDGNCGITEYGYAVAGAGDVNRDGKPDVLVSQQCPAASPSEHSYGAHFVYSGVDGAELSSGFASTSFPGYGSVTYGYAVSGAGDFDGDGWDDIAVGNPPHSALLGPGVGEVIVLSGRTGGTLAQARGYSSWDYLGYSVAEVGDVNQDGYDDVLVGAPTGSEFSSISRSRVLWGGPSFSGTDCNANNIEDSEDIAAGYALDLDQDGMPDECQPLSAAPGAVSLSLGGVQALVLSAGAEHGGQLYWLLGSATGTAPGVTSGGLFLPLNPDNYLLFTLFHPNNALLPSSLGLLGAAGDGEAAFVLPSGTDPSLAGAILHHAYVVLELAGLTGVFASNAMPLALAP